MAASAAGNFVKDMLSSYLSGKTVKAMLVGSGFVFDKHVHEFRSSVTGEVSGTGYTAGGMTLTGVAAQLDAANSRVELVANNADFGSLTVTAAAQIITYISTGSAATDRIIGVHTFTPVSPAGVNFTYAWSDDDGNATTPGLIGYLPY
jgi:hypothetical protein